MLTKNTAQEFVDSIRAAAGQHQPADLALTVAQMLAAVRLWPKAQGNVAGFLDQSRELTHVDWQAILQALGRQWNKLPGRAVNPFDQPLHERALKSGALEHLRQLILGCVLNGSTTASIPTWLLQSTLSLMEQQDLFGRGPKSLDPKLHDLIVRVVGPVAGQRVFCAYDGAASIALELASKGADVALDLFSPLEPLFICLAQAGDLQIRVRAGDPLELARADIAKTPLLPDLYDTSVVCPPFGARREVQSDDDFGTNLPRVVSSEGAGVTLALARGQKTALCIVSPGFLFQTSKADQVFKEQVIRRYGLDAVVSLPRGVFYGSSIAAALLLFKPTLVSSEQSRSKHDVFFVSADAVWDRFDLASKVTADLAAAIANRKTTDNSLTVTVDELAASDFNLSVERYVLDPEARRFRELTAEATTVVLDDVVELYRPQATPNQKGVSTAQQKELAEVGVADIDEAGLIRAAGKPLVVTPEIALQARKARLEAGDVLLVIKGSVGRVGFIRQIPEGEIWLASQSFVILRLRRHAPLRDPKVLFRFLSSNLGQASIQSLRVGTAVPGLQMADVRRLAVVLPDEETQVVIAHDVADLFTLQDKIETLRIELAEKQSQIWPENLGLPPQAAVDNAPHQKSKIIQKKIS